MPNLPWSDIDTLLLDMDGTLLDLHFDNHFWLDYLPWCYAQKHQLSLSQAKAIVEPKLAAYHGQLLWYCTDFWAQTFELPIVQMKRDTAHLIALRPEVEAFLYRLRQAGKQLVLITNAHPDSLAIKLDKVALRPMLDKVISSHQYGFAKEQQAFWQALQQDIAFDPKRSLFIDDSLTVLRSAQAYGIAHNYAVAQPDSQQPARQIDEFPSVHSFLQLIEHL